MNRNPITLTLAVLGMAAFLTGPVLAQRSGAGTSAQPPQPGQPGQPAQPGPAGGQPRTPDSMSRPGSGSDIQQVMRDADSLDKLFIACTALENYCEIELAQLAEQKSQSPQVKEVAQRIRQDHQKSNQQLQQVAQESGMMFPQGVPSEMQQGKQVLQSLSGREFDQAYISFMRANHARAIIAYQDMTQLAKSPRVKQFTTEQLPSLREHYRMVERAAVALGLPSGALNIGLRPGEQPGQLDKTDTPTRIGADPAAVIDPR